jgi:hypothetical protein
MPPDQRGEAAPPLGAQHANAATTMTTTATATMVLNDSKSVAGGGPSLPPPPSRILPNPYAQRKAPPEIFKEPLSVDDGPLASERSAAPEASRAEADAATVDQSAAGSTAATTDPSVTRSSDLPPWERLPSRNLSFTSAEIVTVSELCQNGQHRRGDGEEARSVRVLGVLTHRHVHSDASVSLVLKDPLAQHKGTPTLKAAVKPPPQSSLRPSRFQRPQPASSAASLPNSRPVSIMKPTTPATGPASALLKSTPNPLSAASATASTTASVPREASRTTATPMVRSMIRPQPLRSRSAPPPGSSSAQTEGGGGRGTSNRQRMPLSGHKRPWTATLRPNAAPAAPPDPLRDLAIVVASRDASGSNNLWVVVRRGYETVNQLSVGDLVTVIGEVYWTRYESCVDDDASLSVAALPEAVRQVLRHLAMPSAAHQQPQELEEEGRNELIQPKSTATTGGSSKGPCSVVHMQARILQPSNGINVALFVQALKARRQLLAGSCAT